MRLHIVKNYTICMKLSKLQIIDEIAEYDDELADKFETERKLLLNNDSEEAILELSKQVSNMGPDLKSDCRDKFRNRQLGRCRIVFPTTVIVAKDMFEWETNLELAIDIEAFGSSRALQFLQIE